MESRVCIPMESEVCIPMESEVCIPMESEACIPMESEVCVPMGSVYTVESWAAGAMGAVEAGVDPSAANRRPDTCRGNIPNGYLRLEGIF
jgi:hypothetical protein